MTTALNKGNNNKLTISRKNIKGKGQDRIGLKVSVSNGKCITCLRRREIDKRSVKTLLTCNYLHLDHDAYHFPCSLRLSSFGFIMTL